MLLKTLTKNFNILSNADVDVDVDGDADAVVTAIALPVFTYRRAKNCFEVRFYIHFLNVSPYVYSPGQGRQSTGDKILMTTERPFLFAHKLQVSK